MNSLLADAGDNKKEISSNTKILMEKEKKVGLQGNIGTIKYTFTRQNCIKRNKEFVISNDTMKAVKYQIIFVSFYQ